MARKKSQKKLLEEVAVELGLFAINPALAALPATRDVVKKSVHRAAKKMKEAAKGDL